LPLQNRATVAGYFS